MPKIEESHRINNKRWSVSETLTLVILGTSNFRAPVELIFVFEDKSLFLRLLYDNSFIAARISLPIAILRGHFFSAGA